MGPDDISAGEVNDILQDNGFNGTGRWSDDDNIIPSRQAQQALAYAPFLSFLGEYDASGSSAGLDFPVFDDGFQAGIPGNGEFEVLWMNPRTGDVTEGATLQGGDSQDIGDPPSQSNQDWAVVVTATGG